MLCYEHSLANSIVKECPVCAMIHLRAELKAAKSEAKRNAALFGKTCGDLVLATQRATRAEAALEAADRMATAVFNHIPLTLSVHTEVYARYKDYRALRHKPSTGEGE